MKIDVERVVAFMNNLKKQEDYLMLKHLIHIRDMFSVLTDEYNMTPEEICDRMGINKIHKGRFTRGGYNYTISHIAHINALINECKMKKLAESLEKNNIV